MIPGLAIDPSIEAFLWAEFAGWADHFQRELRDTGVRGLIQQYGELVESVENRSCTHGPNGARLDGAAWESCCGMSYEYQNDLAVRDALAMIEAAVPPAAIELYQEELIRLDLRLHLNYPAGCSRTGRWWRTALPLCIAS
jgi:hypothetical protein